MRDFEGRIVVASSTGTRVVLGAWEHFAVVIDLNTGSTSTKLETIFDAGGERLALSDEMGALDWAKKTVAHGYVAFVVDPVTSRGQPVCAPASPSNHYRGTKDAFQALAHLRRFPFVDPERVGLLGFSWGAMVGLLASSQTFADLFSPSQRYVTAVGFYPLCHVGPMQGRPAVDFVRPDHDRPALILLAEQDLEAPAADCLSLLKAQAARGQQVEWHVYPGATHCWDCSSLDNYSKTDFRGVRVTYRFNNAVTEDSAKRVFEYLGTRLKRP